MAARAARQAMPHPAQPEHNPAAAAAQRVQARPAAQAEPVS
jgi:hypothetical protein